MISEWDKNSAGNVSLCPVWRYEAADLYGLQIGLRLEISGPDPDAPHRFVQLSIEPEQAEDLAQLLLLVVDSIRAQRAAGPTN